MNNVQLQRLISGLQNLSGEKEWVEFKENRAVPEDIGEYISALSNSARLRGEPYGYMVWGIKNKTHEVVGTTFIPEQAKQGNEELEHWLVRLSEPRVNICFHKCTVADQNVVVMEIPATLHTPVKFKGTEFIRIGSLKKKLKDYPEKERELWQVLNSSRFEQDIAKSGLDSDETLRLLDYPNYFEMTGQPLPSNKNGILEKLKADSLIQEALDGLSITNLGAVLFARNLHEFERLARKGLRVIQYDGKNRIKTKREGPGSKGYAIGFEGAISYINTLLPENEEIGQALRQQVRMYPELAIRELVANALIHQDFTITGTGPMVEIFDDRIEVTNPGCPLINTLRMLDEPPRSRNESLAALMRRMNICEERGSGIDKVIFAVELYQLPPPDFTVKDQAMIVTLYGRQSLQSMEKADRIRACYQHACLKYVSNEQMMNATLRKRLNIASKNSAQASRIISETIDAELIKPSDPDNQSRRHKKYVPYWA